MQTVPIVKDGMEESAGRSGTVSGTFPSLGGMGARGMSRKACHWKRQNHLDSRRMRRDWPGQQGKSISGGGNSMLEDLRQE